MYLAATENIAARKAHMAVSEVVSSSFDLKLGWWNSEKMVMCEE
jgi:hypothetical protein